MSLEGIHNETPKPTPVERWPYFTGVASSKEFLAAKTFVEKHIATGKYEGGLTESPEDIEALTEYVTSLGKRLGIGVDPEGVVEELRKGKVLSAPPNKKKEEKIPEFLQTKYVRLEGLVEAEIDEEQLKIMEANILSEELEKANVFANPEELELVYQKSSQEAQEENDQYYYDFETVIKGGREEIEADLRELQEKKKLFKENEPLNQKERERLEGAKKVAAITEHAIEELSWDPGTVRIHRASEFDDIKRGVDDLMEISVESESSILALGIDVTFRGLYSEQFKQKFFKLLKTIRDGYKTKVKYFKDSSGHPLPEFSVPKMVLYFNMGDVKEMVEILKADGASEPKRDTSQKVNILRQIIQSCKILSSFGEESHNDISEQYVDVLESLKKLAPEHPEVMEAFESNQNTEIYNHFKRLVDEFRTKEMQLRA